MSAPGESEKDFRLRLQQTGRERRDELLERVRQRYAARIASLEERIRRAGQAVDREKEQAKQQKLQTAISVGVTLMDVFIGRKGFRRTSLGRATTAARGAGRILKEGQDVGRAQENVQALQQQLAELQAQVAQETEALKTAVDPLTEELETLEVEAAQDGHLRAGPEPGVGPVLAGRTGWDDGGLLRRPRRARGGKVWQTLRRSS